MAITKSQYASMTPEEKRKMLFDYRNRLVEATTGQWGTDEDEVYRIGRELNQLDPSLIKTLDNQFMGGLKIKDLLDEELSGSELSEARNAFFPSTAPQKAVQTQPAQSLAEPTPAASEPAVNTEAQTQKPAVNPATVSLDQPSTEPGPGTGRIAMANAPTLQYDPKSKELNEFQKERLSRELMSEGADAVRQDISNDRRDRRISQINKDLDADMAESWARSATGRRDGRKWNELDPETKQTMRDRFMSFRENMDTRTPVNRKLAAFIEEHGEDWDKGAEGEKRRAELQSLENPGAQGDIGARGPAGPAGAAGPASNSMDRWNSIQRDLGLPAGPDQSTSWVAREIARSDAEKRGETFDPKSFDRTQRELGITDSGLSPAWIASEVAKANAKQGGGAGTPSQDPVSPPPAVGPMELPDPNPQTEKLNFYSFDETNTAPAPAPAPEAAVHPGLQSKPTPELPQGPVRNPSQGLLDLANPSQTLAPTDFANQLINNLPNPIPQKSNSFDANSLPKLTEVTSEVPDFSKVPSTNPPAPTPQAPAPQAPAPQAPAPQAPAPQAPSIKSQTYIPVYGKSGFMGHQLDGRMIQAPKGLGAKDHLRSLRSLDQKNEFERQTYRDNNPFSHLGGTYDRAAAGNEERYAAERAKMEEYKKKAAQQRQLQSGYYPKTNVVMSKFDSLPQSEQLTQINQFRKKRGEEPIFNPYT